MTGAVAIDEIVVVIPANDEELRIGECLAAIGAASRRLESVRDAPRVTTLVVLDACSDRTAEIVAGDPEVEAVAVGFENVGSSRAFGVSRAPAGMRGADPARIRVANTDVYVHGANLGVRADSYLGAGGFPPRPEHEDVLLVDELLAGGASWVRTRTADVVTSARTLGPTPGGFAAFVRDNY